MKNGQKHVTKFDIISHNCYRFSHTLTKSDGQNEGQVMWKKLKIKILAPLFLNQILVPESNWLVERFGRGGNTIRKIWHVLLLGLKPGGMK